MTVCQELLGLLYLGNERYADALKQFSATGLTSVASVADSARSLAAQRQYVQAETKLRPVSSGIASLDINMHETPIAMAFDQGHWDEAWKQLDAAKHDAAKVDAGLFNYFLGIEASLIFLRESDAAVKTTVRDYVKIAVDESNRAAAVDRADAQFAVLFAAYLAAHSGDIPLAQGTLDRIGPDPQSGEYPALAKMLVIARAEIARAVGKPKEAIALFGANLDDSALCLAHVALMDAYAADKDFAAARDQAKWLTQHRGRAYAEYAQGEMPLPHDVVQSDLGWLYLAEFSAQLGDKAQARAALEQFRKIWPAMPQKTTLAARVDAVQTKLD